jgi:hypothetical protein
MWYRVGNFSENMTVFIFKEQEWLDIVLTTSDVLYHKNDLM